MYIKKKNNSMNDGTQTNPASDFSVRVDCVHKSTLQNYFEIYSYRFGINVKDFEKTCISLSDL